MSEQPENRAAHAFVYAKFSQEIRPITQAILARNPESPLTEDLFKDDEVRTLIQGF